MVFTVLIVMTGYIKELVFLLVVVGNLVIGIAQEIVTKKTLDKLSVIVAAKVTVARNGDRRGGACARRCDAAHARQSGMRGRDHSRGFGRGQ